MQLATIHEFSLGLPFWQSWSLHSASLLLALAALMTFLATRNPTRRWQSVAANLCAATCLALLCAYLGGRAGSHGVGALQTYFAGTQIAVVIGVTFSLSAQTLSRKSGFALWLYPLLSVLMLLSTTLDDSGVRAEDASDLMLIAHVSSAVAALALFCVGAALAMAFLLQERSIASLRNTEQLDQLPPMERTFRLLRLSVGAGLIAVSLSLGLGFAMVWNDVGSWLLKPIVLSFLAMWLLYAVLIVGSTAGRIGSRSTVYLVLIGFILIAATYFLAGAVSELKRVDSPAAGAR